MVAVQVRTVCPHDCPDQCSILATVDNGRLLAVAGDPEHPFTRGFLCEKVRRYPERVYSPERLHTPLRRTGARGEGVFAPITWDEALDEIAGRWRQIIAEDGGEALLGYAYSGHMGVVNRGLPQALFHALGATRLNAGTVCDSACMLGWEYSVGPTPGTDPESVAGSDLVICWSANVVTTNVHIVPFIDQARRAGGRLVVIDPFRTRTAARADWHIAPRVGTDTALALGVMHVLVREGLIDHSFLRDHTTGFERLRDEVLPRYTPERASEITGVPAADIERLARMYGEARAPYLRIGQGMTRNRGGGMAARTVSLLPSLVGAWTKPGGGALMYTAYAWEFDYAAIRRPDLLPRPTRTVNHSTLGRDLIEMRNPPIRALFVAANNPAVTCPDQARVRAGLAREDLFTVVHDPFLSDTARYADIVLPATTAVETDDLYRSYGSYYVQYGPASSAPVGEARSNHQLVQALAERLGLTDPVFSRDVRGHLELLLAGATGASAALDLAHLLAGGPVKLHLPPPVPPRTYFYSEQMAKDGLPPLPEWTPDMEEPAVEAGEPRPLRLLTLPGHFQHHTAFAGVASLRRRQGAPACVLHPEDAAARGIRDGDPVRMVNNLGGVAFIARVSSDTQPGVVAVEGSRRAADHAGQTASLNLLTSDTLSDLGEGATYQSTWVQVERAG